MAYPFQNRFTSSTEGEFGPLIPLDNLDMFAESNSQSEDSAWVHNNPLNRLSETLNHYPIPLFSPSKFPLDHENVQPSNFHDTVDASSSLFAYSSEGDSHVMPPNEAGESYTVLILPSGSPSQVAAEIHGPISSELGIRCDECGAVFYKRSLLLSHAKQAQHAPHICQCGKKCSRLDVLERHIQSFEPKTTHPCPFCNKFRGEKAFARRDHLLQHLRCRHNIEPVSDSDESQLPMQTRQRTPREFSCPHEDCPYFRSQDSRSHKSLQVRSRAFRSRSELTRHLREVHSESPYGCKEPYCSRTGGRGFFRQADLLRHKKDHHPIRDAVFDASSNDLA